MPETDKPRWEVEGADWPNRAASRFITAGGLRWHVQQMGQGPALLLLHGTGAATHSWRDLAPRLAPHFTVVAPDLPGHGFTATPPLRGLSLPGMAKSLAALLAALGVAPVLVAGHSAGAAIAARMCLDGAIHPAALISLNGAFLPLGGVSATFFSPLAKLMARTPVVPQLFAWRAADRRVVDRLMAGTGSVIDARGMSLYARLVRRPGHAAAALGMMASWDLAAMPRELPALVPRLVLVAGANDRTISPASARTVAALVPGSTVISLPRLGHLAHEEQPGETAELILRIAREAGVL